MRTLLVIQDFQPCLTGDTGVFSSGVIKGFQPFLTGSAGHDFLNVPDYAGMLTKSIFAAALLTIDSPFHRPQPVTIIHFLTVNRRLSGYLD